MEKSELRKSKASSRTLTNRETKSKGAAASCSGLTKRGVYVESNLTKVSSSNIVSIATQNEHRKAPARPKRVQKRFLASAINILSKPTTRAQGPDTIKMNPVTKKASKHYPFENRDTKHQPSNYTKHGKEENVATMFKTEKRKRRYRSKIVENYREYNQKNDFKVIYPIKMPSLQYSDISTLEENTDKIKWSDFLPRLVNPDQSEVKLEKETKLTHLAREVAEGRMANNNQIKIESGEEPNTLVSSQYQNENGVYDLFFDLLETTFNVYSAETNDETAPNISSEISSKVALEINESVAKKLNIGTVSSRGTSSPPVQCVRRIKNNGEDQKLLENFQSRQSKFPRPQPQSAPAKKKRMKPDNNVYVRKIQNTAPHCRSAENTQSFDKTFNKYNNLAPCSQDAKKTRNRKQSKKSILMNMLREQLSTDNYPFEEPENMYQALKVMAKNKRKTQKKIRFEKFTTCEQDKKTTAKKRKISAGSKLKNKHDEYSNKTPSPKPFNHGRKGYPKPASPRASTVCASKHSLQVFNVNYDTPVKVKRTVKKLPKEVSLPYHSSNSEIEQENKRSDPITQQIIMTVETICGNPEKMDEFICLDDL